MTENEAFEKFWAAFPNKVAKVVARRAFKACWSEVEAILAGVIAYVASKPPDRPWLHPSTFLNQRRWEDEPAPLGPSFSKASSSRASHLAPLATRPDEARRSEMARALRRSTYEGDLH